ncbi:MAG: O-antigen ligase family protein [Thermodesulfobacteriota bacterium]
MPIRVDFHFVYTEGVWIRPINGFGVSAFDVFFLLAMGSWMLRAVLDHRLRIRLFPGISIPFLLVWIIAIPGVLRTTMPDIVMASVIWTVFKNWLVFIYIANNIHVVGSIRQVVVLLLVVGMLQSLIGLAQYVTGGKLGLAMFGEAERSFFEMRAGAGTVSRVAGTLGHPNKLAVFLNLLLQMNFALFFAGLSRRVKLALCIPFALMGLTMLLTYSRGGWLGLALGGTVVLYWCLAKNSRNRLFSVVLMTVFLGIFLIVVIGSVQSVKRRLFEDDYGTAALRIPMSVVALNIIRHFPLTGVGLNNYTAVIERHDTTAMAVSYDFPRPVHNEFLLIAAEQGLIGLGLFLVILAQMFIVLFRTARSPGAPFRSWVTIGFFGGWLGWCLHHQFEYEYVFFSEITWVLFGLFQAMTLLQDSQPQENDCVRP